jgi:glycosyltransferase involved in cell wall biosynthesis
MKWPTNIGYAIGVLERLFYDIALELAGGDASRVHFVFPDISGGAPRTLPAGFTQYSQLDINENSPRMLAQLDQLVRKHGVDFALTFDMQPVHPMYRVMRAAGVRSIVSYWGAPISGPSPAWKRWLKRAQLAMSGSRVDGLVFESQAMADLALFGRGVPRSMVDVVMLGVDAQRFRPESSNYVHETLAIPAGRRVFVFSGHCTPRKGIRTLIEAAIEVLHVRRRRDVFFLLCGNQGEESKPYEALYAGLGIDEGIRFAGYRTDLLRIFQSAYCGVIPSSGWDSFTMSSVEMAATGLPIVASRLQGLAEAVLDRQTGLLFEPGNARELADRIEWMLDHPEQAREFGRAGRARVERELTLEAQRQNLKAAFRRHLPA